MRLGDVGVYRCRYFSGSGGSGTMEYGEEMGARLCAQGPGRSKRTPHRFKGLADSAP